MNKLTVVAALCAAMVFTPSFADTNITENVTLTADTDWSGLGLVTVESGVTVELSGCKLSLDGLAGEGSIVTIAVVSEDLTNSTDAETAASTTTNGVRVVMAGDDKYPAEFAFNDVYTSKTGVGSGCLFTDSFSALGSLEINYDFGETIPQIVNCYRIMGYSCQYYTSCPKTWTFEGSDDFVTWTELDSKSNQSWTINEWKDCYIDNTTAYRYYRLKVTAVTGTGIDAKKLYIAEIEYKYAKNSKVEIVGGAASDFSGLSFSQGAPVSVSGNIVLSSDVDLRSSSATVSIDGTIDLAGHEMWLNGLDGTGTITDSSSFDLTNPSGTVSSTNNYLNSDTVAAKAFCDAASYDTTHRVIADIRTQSPIQIDYTFPAATVVNAYRVMSNGSSKKSAEARAPKSIKFYGSNDGIEMMELDDRSHETGWDANEERQYEFMNETAYTRYRIEFYESKGGEYIEFFKLEYGNTGRSGRLHVAVPSGTKTNSGVALSGNLRLVKEGEGTLVVAKTEQTYAGGTEVAGGILKPGAEGRVHPFGAEGRDIVVRESAVLDAAGQIGFGKYEITLDGGTLRNTGNGAGNEAQSQFRRVRLAKDSSLTSTSDMFFGVSGAEASTIYLGGHRLAVSIGAGKYLRFYDTAILDGTFDITSGGYFLAGGNAGIVATNNVDFLACCALAAAMPIKVANYTANWISTSASATSANSIEVYGTFTPATTHFHGVEMQDSSTIDLTGWSGGWPLASDLNAGVKDVLFASGATVKIDISGRTDMKALAKSASPYLLTWSSVPSNVTFAMADGSTYVDGVRLRYDETGLKVESMPGLIITIQ